MDLHTLDQLATFADIGDVDINFGALDSLFDILVGSSR